MNFIKIIRQQDGSYNVVERKGGNLNIFFAYFFIDDISCVEGVRKKREWLFDSEREETGGNISFVEKEGNDIIVGFHLNQDDYYEHAIRLTRENFVILLEQWEQLCKEKPQEIWIFEKNGKVWLEGRN